MSVYSNSDLYSREPSSDKDVSGDYDDEYSHKKRGYDYYHDKPHSSYSVDRYKMYMGPMEIQNLSDSDHPVNRTEFLQHFLAQQKQHGNPPHLNQRSSHQHQSININQKYSPRVTYSLHNKDYIRQHGDSDVALHHLNSPIDRGDEHTTNNGHNDTLYNINTTMDSHHRTNLSSQNIHSHIPHTHISASLYPIDTNNALTYPPNASQMQKQKYRKKARRSHRRRVIGAGSKTQTHRLPSTSDMTSLPYLHADAEESTDDDDDKKHEIQEKYRVSAYCTCDTYIIKSVYEKLKRIALIRDHSMMTSRPENVIAIHNIQKTPLLSTSSIAPTIKPTPPLITSDTTQHRVKAKDRKNEKNDKLKEKKEKKEKKGKKDKNEIKDRDSDSDKDRDRDKLEKRPEKKEGEKKLGENDTNQEQTTDKDQDKDQAMRDTNDENVRKISETPQTSKPQTSKPVLTQQEIWQQFQDFLNSQQNVANSITSNVSNNDVSENNDENTSSMSTNSGSGSSGNGSGTTSSTASGINNNNTESSDEISDNIARNDSDDSGNSENSDSNMSRKKTFSQDRSFQKNENNNDSIGENKSMSKQKIKTENDQNADIFASGMMPSTPLLLNSLQQQHQYQQQHYIVDIHSEFDNGSVSAGSTTSLLHSAMEDDMSRDDRNRSKNNTTENSTSMMMSSSSSSNTIPTKPTMPSTSTSISTQRAYPHKHHQNYGTIGDLAVVPLPYQPWDHHNSVHQYPHQNQDQHQHQYSSTTSYPYGLPHQHPSHTHSRPHSGLPYTPTTTSASASSQAIHSIQSISSIPSTPAPLTGMTDMTGMTVDIGKDNGNINTATTATTATTSSLPSLSSSSSPITILLQTSKVTLTYYGSDVLNIKVRNDEYHMQKQFFVFEYGCVAFFNCTEREEKDFLYLLQEMQEDSLIESELGVGREDLLYAYGTSFAVSNDTVTLSSDTTLEKLSIAFVMAQCVKLNVFEERIDQEIEKTRSYPESLAKTGSIGLTRKEMAQKIGKLFIERNNINLHADILDAPEFFWEQDKYKYVYDRLFTYLELGKRVHLLNKRLAIMKELFDMISDQLDNVQAEKLEYIIIYLIVIEVIIAVGWQILIKDLFGYFK